MNAGLFKTFGCDTDSEPGVQGLSALQRLHYHIEQVAENMAAFQNIDSRTAAEGFHRLQIHVLCPIAALPYQMIVAGGVPRSRRVHGTAYAAFKFRKCYEALKAGGLFISFENFAPDTETGKQLYLNRGKQYQLENERNEAEVKAHIARYGKDCFPITIEEHKTLIRACGFDTAELSYCPYMQVGS